MYVSFCFLIQQCASGAQARRRPFGDGNGAKDDGAENMEGAAAAVVVYAQGKDEFYLGTPVPTVV
jgi:hypothetical protein